MASVYLSWIASAVVMCLLGLVLGANAIRRGWLGILIDERGRYSLTRFQISMWTVIVLSLVFGVFWGRLRTDAATALDFSIPNELLTVLGISVGSTVVATTIKTTKDSSSQSSNIAASDSNDKPRLAQMFLVEEGSEADKVIDITKFQNFWITVLLGVAYVILAIATLRGADSPDKITALPGFDEQFVTLLAISHAGYLIAKVPNKPGPPAGLTVSGRRAGATPAPAPAAVANPAPTYTPRNP